MSKDDCPDIVLLNRLLAGGLSPEREQALSGHLDLCAKCRDRLERVAAGDRTLNDVARNQRGTGEMTDALKRVIHKCTSDPMILIRGSSGSSATPILEHDSDDFHISTENQNRDEVTQHDRILPQTPAIAPISPGDRLGNYEILEEIGHGGMGVVWKARDPRLNRFVAIKVLNESVLSDWRARKRFLREARAIAAVDDRHVVKMYEVEESPVPYFVMEFVDGPSLRSHLARSGPLDLPNVLRLGMQIACGLEASHARGITHRDVKPANIVLDLPTGRAKLTDFGLAHIDGDARLTMTGFVAGTPAYMSPEQAMGDQVDHRSDLFSLGSVLYAMSTGRSPFADDHTVANRTVADLDRVCKSEPASPQAINPDVPESLVDLIRWLHSKHPADRPASAREVARILGQQLEQLTHQAEPLEPGQQTRRPADVEPIMPRPTLRPDATFQHQSPGTNRHQIGFGSRSLLITTAAVTCLVVLVIVGFIYGGRALEPLQSIRWPQS